MHVFIQGSCLPLGLTWIPIYPIYVGFYMQIEQKLIF